MILNWKTTDTEADLIKQITDRTLRFVPEANRMAVNMDITACHLNDTALDLARLLALPDPDFMHDVGGISAHLDRRTGKLQDCFVPRCARREPTEEQVAAAREAALDLIFRAQSVD